MKCPLCESELEESYTTVKRTVNKKKIRVRNVPCLQCQNEDCEEQLIHSPSVKRMRRLIEDIRQGKIEEKENYNYNEIII